MSGQKFPSECFQVREVLHFFEKWLKLVNFLLCFFGFSDIFGGIFGANFLLCSPSVSMLGLIQMGSTAADTAGAAEEVEKVEFNIRRTLMWSNSFKIQCTHLKLEHHPCENKT